MALPDLSLRRPVATSMLCVAVAVLGVVSFLRLPVDLLPDVAFPTLAVSTVYPDAGPAEVERIVTLPIEEQLSRLPGVREVASRSRQGRSLVRVRFGWGTDMDFAMLHVRERLDDLAGALPRSVEKPTILRTDPASEPIITLAVTGRDPLALRSLSEGILKRRLEQLDAVALAAVTGGPRPEIQVEVDPARLAAYGLAMEDVRRALDSANYSAPGGTVRRGRFEYSLRTLGEFRSLDDLRRVALAPVGGERTAGDGGAGDGAGRAPLRLGDVAEVSEGLEERRTIARFDGRPAVGIRVHKESGTNTVRVDDRVRESLEELRAEFPDVTIEVASSQARFVREAISNVAQALLLGGFLAFVVLFLFLRDPRYPVAVGLAIPISVLAAFGFLYLFDVSLNVMSLGGLALGVGMLVDNSIVVLENIFRHREDGREAGRAASLGAREVAAAITASTLTTIAVFGPVLYVEGVAGALFEELSLSVAFSLLASLAVALTLLPVLADRLAGSGAREGAFGGGDPDGGAAMSEEGPGGDAAGGALGRASARLLDSFERGFERLAARYEEALRWSLDHRAVVALAALGSLALAAALAAGLPRSPMPEVDEGRFHVELELPVGTPLRTTEETAVRLEGILREMEGVDAVFTRVGLARGEELAGGDMAGLESAALEVRLASGAPPAREAAVRFRRLAREAGVDPHLLAVSTGRATSLGRALALADADLAVRIQGEDLQRGLALADSAARRLGGLPGLADVRVDLRRTRPELEVEVDRAAAARHGLDVREVADAVEGYLRGVETERRFTRFAQKLDIRVRVPAERRRALGDVLGLRVDGVPLRNLVEVRRTHGPAEIRREGQSRTARVLAAVEGEGLGDALEAVEARLAGLAVPPGLTLRVGGANEEMRESFRSLLLALGLAFFLVYLILAAQFESLLQPVVILVAVPLAAVGAVAALWLTGGGLNVMSGIGVVVLVGIVVNDAIVKVDFINQRRAAGRDVRAAIEEAGRIRLRPIVMTTVTTVLGLLPLALGWGAGADLRAPLAVAVIGGLLSSTALTLLVVPVVYSLVAPRP